MTTTKHDLLIKNGTIVDPSQKLHAQRDIAFANGKVAAVESNLATDSALETIDATGLIVTPGLIDLHVHAFWGSSAYGVLPDPVNVAKGVTTILDAGSSGARTFPGFRHYVIDQAVTRTYALLNISSAGMISESHVGELEDLRWAEVDKAITVARQNRDVVPGIKVRLGKLQSGNNTVESLKRAIEAAEAIDGFVMSHIGACPVPIEELAAMMRPGDVVTHAFHGIGDRIANLDGVLSGILEARERGVLFDVGHGMGGFSFDTAERALAAGFVPDNISTALHIFNVEGPVYDLVTTLTKFMHLGMSLDDVIERSTISAARIMGLKGGYGTLAVGAIGDAAILRLDEGRFTLNDRLSKALNIGGMTWQKPISVDASTKLSHVRTIIRGQIYRPWQGQRP